MDLIKLDATDSTNAHLRRLLQSDPLIDYTVVMAAKQEHGRGQMGTEWQSEAGKNLTFSVLRRDLNWHVNQGFLLNLCVSLALHSVLKALHVPDLSVKWPNDILSGRSKICGILIENTISSKKITTSIIGIGLNVNQLKFNNLPHVSSLKLLLDTHFDLDGLLYQIIGELQMVFWKLEEKGADSLWDAYKELLFRKGRPSTFENRKGERFVGIIEGVSLDGKLLVSLEDGVVKSFNFKEVKFLN